ncbi:uncharacterized protein E0L32_005479 [Thyridium curvatum]|uniref:HNH nuclease domain-containing protein n=1 Tax=Thyridium curvatum TaxID=1093900 RepID=A0A507AUM8_9PEZI|nr:uncharacterized protein E0L32_005479 [Thyridium curvatum]TPX14515.1 hypothetical protein E0L32_005479 [Thyridium curvatum]
MENLLAKLGVDGVRKLQAASAADLNAMVLFAGDISPPTEEVLDYVTELDTRCILYDQLRAFGNETGLVYPALFAVTMVAPVSELRSLLQVLHGSTPNDRRMLFRNLTLASHMGIKDYLSKPRSPDARRLLARPPGIHIEPGMPIPPVSVSRSGFSERVKNRDGYRCIFTGTSDPEAAPIFPFSASSKRMFVNINDTLLRFWGPEKSTAWRRAYEDTELTQSAKNGISMNRQLYFWFDQARFALKPLRETPEGIIVQWHWLKETFFKPRALIEPEETVQQTVRYSGVEDGSWGNSLAHRPSGVAIQTGQTFLLPAHEQMPSWDLLQMQWNLLRVAALCGAAGITDDYYDYEDLDEHEYDIAVWAKKRAIDAECCNCKAKKGVS